MNVAVVIFVLPKPELFTLVEFGGGLETIARNEDVIEKAHRNENAWGRESYHLYMTSNQPGKKYSASPYLCINNGPIIYPKTFSLVKLSRDTLDIYVCFIFYT